MTNLQIGVEGIVSSWFFQSRIDGILSIFFETHLRASWLLSQFVLSPANMSRQASTNPSKLPLSTPDVSLVSY